MGEHQRGHGRRALSTDYDSWKHNAPVGSCRVAVDFFSIIPSDYVMLHLLGCGAARSTNQTPTGRGSASAIVVRGCNVRRCGPSTRSAKVSTGEPAAPARGTSGRGRAGANPRRRHCRYCSPHCRSRWCPRLPGDTSMLMSHAR